MNRVAEAPRSPHSQLTAPARRRTASALALSTANDHGCHAISAVFSQSRLRRIVKVQ